MTDVQSAKLGLDVAKALSPLLHKAFRPLKKAYAISEVVLRGNYEEYVARSTSALTHLCTILDPTTNLRFDEVYVPLTIKNLRGGREFEISKFPDKLFRGSPHNLIIDTAGMGKSTLSRHIFLESTRSSEAKKLPIFIELRRMKTDEGLLALVARELALFKGTKFSPEVLTSILATGQFLLILDGVDELIDSARSNFVEGLRQLIASCDTLDLWITSRNDPILTEFPSLERWRVAPLKREAAYEIIQRYEKNKEIANQLVATLKASDIESIETFLGTPLLVVLLVSSYEQKPHVPVKRSNFYYQVFDALFERHDALKGGLVRPRESSLSIDQFYSVLKAFCFMLIKDGTVEIDQMTFENRMGHAKRLVPQIAFSSEAVKNDLLNAVPLMTLDAGKLRFAHKSMIDFFAAAYICNDLSEKQALFLNRIFDSKQVSRLSELLRFCADLDFLTFRKTILRKLAEEIVAFEATQADHLALPDSEASALFIRASFFSSHAIAVVKLSPTSSKSTSKRASALSLMHIPDGTTRARPFDSVTIDVPRPERVVFTQFRNAYTFFAALAREQNIPFLTRYSSRIAVAEDFLDYLFTPIETAPSEEPIAGRELTAEDIQLVATHGDLGQLSSRTSVLPEFAAASAFLRDLAREAVAEDNLLADAFDSITDAGPHTSHR